MTNTSKEALKTQLELTRINLFEYARSLKESDWTQPIYTHGEEWTAQDILRHLTWAEGGMIRLIEQIRQGEQGVPEDFDLNRYNASGVKKLKEKTPAELMAMMATNRERLLELVDGLSEEEMALEGRHGSLQVMSIERILQVIANHEEQHLADLRGVGAG